MERKRIACASDAAQRRGKPSLLRPQREGTEDASWEVGGGEAEGMQGQAWVKAGESPEGEGLGEAGGMGDRGRVYR
jgi:hypothetical protein